MLIDHIIVAIPAHNEERRIAAAIAAVATARAALPAPVSSSLVIGADSCSDETLRRASRLLSPADRIVEVTARCVGTTRKTATAAALDAVSAGPARVWIANTDADSLVPPDWLTRQLALAEHGVTGIAGIVELSSERRHPLLAQRFKDSYVLDEDGSHTHVHGANLGVRADSYLSVGGWTDLTTGEDHDLWNRLRAAGHFLVSTVSLIVATSPRIRGRAPAGFADDLAFHVGIAA